MYFKRSVLALLLSITAFAGAYSQALPDTALQTKLVTILPDTVSLQYFPRDTVWNGAIELLNIIIKYHPDMFAFMPLEVFNQRINEMKHSLPDSLTAYQAYSYIAPVVALVGEGHTAVMAPWDMFLAHNPYWLPERPYIDKADMKLKLTEVPFEYEEIVSINGRPNREIVEQLLSYVGMETMPGRVNTINGKMPLYFALVDSSAVFRVEYISNELGLQTAELEGVRIKEHQHRIGVRDENMNFIIPEGADEPGFNVSRTTPSTVVFSMPAFDKVQAPHVIDSLFAYIKSEPEVTNLIIDLRGNLGGSPLVMNQMLKYLSPVEFYNYADSVNLDLPDTGKILMPKIVAPQPAEKRFDGDLYVLIDNGSYSCSVLLSHFVKQGRFGTLIGEQTGGAVFTYGSFKVPEFTCGLKMICSLIIMWVPDFDRYKQTMEPVYPDIEVPSDKALEKALEVIASPSGKRVRPPKGR